MNLTFRPASIADLAIAPQDEALLENLLYSFPNVDIITNGTQTYGYVGVRPMPGGVGFLWLHQGRLAALGARSLLREHPKTLARFRALYEPLIAWSADSCSERLLRHVGAKFMRCIDLDVANFHRKEWVL